MVIYIVERLSVAGTWTTVLPTPPLNKQTNDIRDLYLIWDTQAGFRSFVFFFFFRKPLFFRLILFCHHSRIFTIHLDFLLFSKTSTNASVY